MRESPIHTWGVRSDGVTEVEGVLSTLCNSFADVGAEGGGKSVMADIEVSELEGNTSEATVADGITELDRSSPVLEGLLL